MVLNVGALVAVVMFYLVILGIGIWAARRNQILEPAITRSENLLLAGRKLGIFVGAFTTTATWVGGGYINGIVEILFTGGSGGGLIWCQGPFGYAFSLIIGGMFFAKPMRTAGYVTMLDPFSQKFGGKMGGLLFIPALLGELLWSASILASLGATVTVIIGVGYTEGTIAAAVVAMIYTSIGGLWSVAITDVAQLSFVFLGLWVCAPFALTYSDAIRPISETKEHWLGKLDAIDIGKYVDMYLMLIFGGIPWQAYFQRVHAAKTTKHAQVISYIAALLCFLMSAPSILIGAVADSTDWNKTDFKHRPVDKEVKLVLPLVLQYLTPEAVAILGLGVVSAAVMSSVDSSMLSASSMFTRNIYISLIRPKASERELLWCIRLSVLCIASISTSIAILSPSVYGLWLLCSDLVYVILFPQLLCVIYLKRSNTYGSLCAYATGLTVRLLAGEQLIELPAVIHFPFYDSANGQLFPFRTFSMLVSLTSLILISLSTDWIFRVKKCLNVKYDVFNCFPDLRTRKYIASNDPSVILMQSISLGRLRKTDVK